MNISRWPILLLIPTLIALNSCGGDSSSSSGGGPTNEEETTTGTTGSTSGTTTGGGGNTCMSATQKSRITNLFNRAAIRGQILGRIVESFRNSDGTFDTTVYEDASIVVSQTTDNTWVAETFYCQSAGCQVAQQTFSVAGTCFTRGGIIGNISFSSSSQLSVKYNDTTQVPPLSDSSVYRLPESGRAQVTTTSVQNGLRIYAFSFVEDSTGGTSSGASTSSSGSSTGSSTGTSTGSSTAATTTAATTGSSTGSSTGTTTGETGTTTGAFSSAMGFGF